MYRSNSLNGTDVDAEGAERGGSLLEKVGTWLAEVGGFGLVLLIIDLTARYSYLLFHTLAELFSIFIASTIFVIVLNNWRLVRNQYLLFIGIAYLFVASLDLLHALSYKGLPIFADYDYYAPQLWIAARYLEATAMLLGFAFLSSDRRVSVPPIFFAFALTSAGLAAAILHFKSFPVCFVAGQGLTPFKVVSEYVICGLLLASLGLLHRRRQRFDARVYRLIQWSLVLMIATELCFTLYVSDAMADFFNEFGHLLKVGTFFLIYKAVVVTALRDPVHLLFRELKDSEQESLRREEALRQSETRYHHLFISSLDAILITAPDGKVFAANQTACDLLQRTEEEICQDGETEIFDQTDPRLANALEERRLTGKFKGELTYLRKDGTKFPVEISTSMFSEKDGSLRSNIIFRDISERKQAEDTLRAAVQAANEANEAKSVFLANMSHEIRTPLNAIVGLAHLLRKEITSPGTHPRIDQIIANSDHLLAIINDILDLSKIEARRLALDQVDFTLGDVVAKVRRIVEQTANDKGLTLKIDIPGKVHEMALHGDPLRLTQVLINLCGNAVKFTDHGKVHLSIKSLAEQADGMELRFAVADTGVGIAMADQARLFSPFEQANSASGRLNTGTGLGLSISQRLVGLMGGTIEVRSAPGEGSTFSFELSLARASASSLPDAKRVELAPPSAVHAQVLVAEDHALGQDILFEMLEDLGCEVDIAADGTEALERARSRHFDLILMDMQMPKMDGLAATRAIRALPGHERTPILALTANAFADDRQRCLEAGMNGHVAKPVTPLTLAKALGEWLPTLSIRAAGKAPVANEISRALAGIPGLDAESVSSMYEPDEHLELLRRFLEKNGDDMTPLRRHLAAGENDTARRIAHGLVGIAGLVGAHDVATLARQIEQGLRTGKDVAEIMDLAAACEIALTQLQEAIGTLPILATALTAS
jgi:PAS domain S-box-containing protein